MDKEQPNETYEPIPPACEAENGYCMDRSRQTIRVNGTLYTARDIRLRLQTATGLPAEPEPTSFRHELDLFLGEWFDEAPTLTVQTSGSTGTPKKLVVRKDRMMQSARLTCRFLGLRPGDTALLCMPLRYIAGKMMVVRALVAGLDLRLQTPSGQPLESLEEPIRFAAMIPLQVYNTLRRPQEAARLRRIEKLIIGGGAIDPALETALRDFPGAVYSTYGMTETLSHIALRRLSGPAASPYYEPFSSVGLSLSPDGALVIDAPLVADGILETNDVAELLPDGRFTILGRKDNIINSGGIKIQIESVEKTLRPLISVNFALTAVPHPKFGEAAVLLVEGPRATADRLRETIGQHLPAYHVPKYILAIERIPLAGNGKISRAECRRLATDRIIIKQ